MLFKDCRDDTEHKVDAVSPHSPVDGTLSRNSGYFESEILGCVALVWVHRVGSSPDILRGFFALFCLLTNFSSQLFRLHLPQSKLATLIFSTAALM